MVYVPTNLPSNGHEYYRAMQTANQSSGQSGAAVSPVHKATEGNTTSTDKQKLGGEEGSLIDPILGALQRRKRRQEREQDERKSPEKQDIVAARVRGGLVQYMRSMGYPVNVAIQEANRALAQISKDDRASGDSASRQVYLQEAKANLSPEMYSQTANDDFMGQALDIATAPRSLVDIKV